MLLFIGLDTQVHYSQRVVEQIFKTVKTWKTGAVLSLNIWGAWPLPSLPFLSSYIPVFFPALSPFLSPLFPSSPSFSSLPLEVGPLKYS